MTETRKLSNPVLYVISSGSYSDYSVHFACPDEKTAEAMVKHLNGIEGRGYDEFGVEELAVYSSLDQIAPITSYRVEVNEDGSERRRFTSERRPWESWLQGTSGWAPAGFAYGVSTRGFAVALKAARDQAAKRKAKKAGVA